MDDDLIFVAIIACIIIGSIVLFIWTKSRGRRQVVKTVKELQESLKLSAFVSGHPQLDAVWCAVRGQVSGITVKIFGGRSRRGKNSGVKGGTAVMAKAVDRSVVLIVVNLPSVIPFRFNLQRKSALSTPRFGTSYEDFDKVVEVITENEKLALTVLNNEQLRTAIITFMKSTSNAFITSSEVMIKVSSDKQVLLVVREAVNLAILIGKQLASMH